MRRIKSFLFAVLFLLPFFSFAGNKENYNKGWEAFNNNDRTNARKYFNLATNESTSKAEAFLSLALLDWNEGKDDGAFADFQKFYENSNDPYPYLYAMFSLPFMEPRQILSANQLKFFEKIAADPNMNGTMKAMIQEKLGEHYFDSNNLKKAKELFGQMGAVGEWQVLGTFDNISGSGYDKDWGAVSKAKTSDAFKDKVEAEVRWYAPPANKQNQWFYFDYYFYLDNIVAYAQTFVNSPVEREVYMRIGTSGSLKVWLNDAQIAAVPEERNCDLDIYTYKVMLNKGNNRILVQIGQGEISAANFMLRLTDEAGNPIGNITSSNSYMAYTPSGNQPTNNLLPFFAEEYFENKIKEDPDNYLYYLALAETYLRNDKSYEGIHILKKAEQLSPKSSFLSYRLSEAYLRSKNRTDYSREMENIKQNDPESMMALQSLFNEKMNSEKYSEAEDICKKIKQLYGESSYTEEMDVQLAGAFVNIDEIVRLSKKLYAKYPSNYEYLSLAYMIENRVNGKPRAALSLLENYSKKYFNADELSDLAQAYMNIGSVEKGLKTLKKRIDYLPYATGYIYDYATTLQKMQRYNEALQVIEDVKKQAPYLSYMYTTEGYIYKEMKDNDKAKESFKKSIYYDPTSYESRTQLRLLENKKEVFELFPKKELDEIIAKAPNASDYPEENSVILLNDNQMVFYPEGAKESRKELAVKILNQSGIKEWKEYSISYNGNAQKLLLDKYEIIKANGQKVKAETDDDGSIVFTNLEVGDVLHLEYRLQNYYTGVLSKHFFDYALMQFNVPTIYCRYAMLIPQDRKFDYLTKNMQMTPAVSDIENMKLYQWVSENRPAIKSEPYMGSFSDIAPVLVYSSIPDWKFISDWYKDLTSNKISANSDYILQETLAEILKGHENAAPLEKAELFYNYILQNITYSNVSFLQSNFIPQKASRTITTRLGDCKDVSTLFVTFCREVGLNANLVLINTKERSRSSLALPSNAFNHCIVQLIADGKTYYLELTNEKLPFGATIGYDLHANILPIPYKDETIGTELLTMDMPFRKTNDIIRYKKMSFNNNDLLIEYKNIRTGELAASSRLKYADMGTEDRLKDVTNVFSSGWSNPIKLTNLNFYNLDNLSDSIEYDFTLEAKDVVQDVANMKIFKLPWTDKIDNLSFVALDERKYPFEFWRYFYSDSENEEITINLPAGKNLVETPKNIKMECSVATYSLTFKTNQKGVVVATRVMKSKKDTLSPGEYAEFKKFMNNVSINDNKQYAIK